MSKKITKDNLIATFPTVLAEDVHLGALASATATELVKLYEDSGGVMTGFKNGVSQNAEKLCQCAKN
mgnify:CR=1 FL=1